VGYNQEKICATKEAGAESLILSPGLGFGLELGGPIRVGQQTVSAMRVRWRTAQPELCAP